jgi:hypothetical protein
VTGNASALLANRFFGNLDQNLLSFFKQIADLRDRLRCALTLEAASAAASALSASSAIESRTCRTLRVPRSPCGSSDLYARIDRSVASSFSV